MAEAAQSVQQGEGLASTAAWQRWDLYAIWHRLGRQSVEEQAAPAPAGPATEVAILDEHQRQQLTIESVREQPLTVERETTGKVSFNEDRLTPVYAPYAGRVLEVLAHKGAAVRPGQPLLVLEAPELVTVQNDLAATRSDLTKARIGLDAARMAAERARGLHTQGAIATKDVQQAELELARAQDEQQRAQAVLARENVRVAQENLELTNATERLINARVKAGDAPEWDLIKFQTGKVQFQRDLATARLAYQQAVRDVLTFMGATFPIIGKTSPAALDAPLEVIGELRAEPLTVSFALEELCHIAIETRPDVLAAQHNIEAARRTLDLAHAQRHRDVDVALEYQHIGGDNTVGATVSVPLFLSHKFEGQIHQGLAQFQQAQAAFDQAKLQAITDVEKAYQAYQASQQLLQVYITEALTKAEASFRIAGVSYRQGATSLLELQEAQRTLNQTRLAANQAFFDYRMSLYQLEHATGQRVVPP